jgi:bacillithiol synthase
LSSAFSPAFLRGEARAHAFLPDDFRHASRRGENVTRAVSRAVSAETIAALKAQAAKWPMTPARAASLEALAKPGTAVVVTGQQVGLFLGPLYSFYKAASAVAVARALQAETGKRCVPVFWLQSEDHDFEEIDHCDVQGADGAPVRLRLAAPGRLHRSSISGLLLGEGVGEQLAQLASLLEGAPHADEVIALFTRHYRAEATWVNAFAGVMSELFDELVLIDPRDETLAAQTREVHARAVRECSQIAAVLSERSASLEREGFTPQVHVRGDAPLSFFHPEGRDGPRYRLEARDGGWGLVGGTEGTPPDRSVRVESSDGALSRAVLETSDPLCFSTSALLRPIVQDTLLPTAAIVGGPGELNYFAQLAPLYAHFGLPMPMLVPRARFRVVEPRTRSVLQSLGLTAAELEAPREALLKRLTPAEQPLSPALLEKRLMEAVAPILDGVPVRPGSDVEDAVKRTRGTIARAASRLSGRYARELQRGDQTLNSRLERARNILMPHGEPQERVYGFPGFAARLSVKAFTSLVLTNLEPFSATVKDLQP